jgi:hypothetical protein
VLRNIRGKQERAQLNKGQRITEDRTVANIFTAEGESRLLHCVYSSGS